MKKPDPFVCILVPSMGAWVSSFGVSLISLVIHTMMKGVKVKVIDLVSSLLPMSRDNLLEAGLESPDVTHFLFLDSDMNFGPDTILRLLARKRPIVGCNYSVKKIPPYPVTTKMNGEYIYTKPDSTGIEEAGGIGFGVLLIERQVIEKMPRPRFLVGWREKLKAYVGEDIYFCNLARHHGFKIYVDHDASQGVGHVGQFTWFNHYEGFEEVVPPHIAEPSLQDTAQVWLPLGASPDEPSQT